MEHVELFGGDAGEVDHASADEGSAIVDAYDYRSAITEIVDLDVGPEGKAAMGCREHPGVHSLAARRLGAQAVPRCLAALGGNGFGWMKTDRRE